MKSFLKSTTKKFLTRHPRVAKSVVLTLEELGQRTLARKVADKSGAFPDIVKIDLPLEKKSFRMLSQNGTDLVSNRAWVKGWDQFEKPMPKVFAEFIKRWPGAVGDIGANTGFYSLIAAELAPDKVIHAFEPFPPVLDILKKNMQLNARLGNIQLFEHAVGAEAGTANLFIPDQSHGLVESSCSLAAEFKETHSGSIPVKVSTLDEHVARHRIEFGILKVDVEGAEPQVLMGSENVFKQQRPILFIELIDRRNEEAMQNFCAKHGYVSYLLTENGARREDVMKQNKVDWNHLLVPSEKEEASIRILKGIEAFLPA